MARKNSKVLDPVPSACLKNIDHRPGHTLRLLQSILRVKLARQQAPDDESIFFPYSRVAYRKKSNRMEAMVMGWSRTCFTPFGSKAYRKTYQ